MCLLEDGNKGVADIEQTALMLALIVGRFVFFTVKSAILTLQQAWGGVSRVLKFEQHDILNLQVEVNSLENKLRGN